MKIFFDTNVYVADALLRKMATRLIKATHEAKWECNVASSNVGLLALNIFSGIVTHT